MLFTVLLSTYKKERKAAQWKASRLCNLLAIKLEVLYYTNVLGNQA